jgi:hypothetical protein
MSAVEATAQRPPLPPFTRDTAIQKVESQKMPGTLVIRRRYLWLTQLTHTGETVRNL